MPRDYRVPKSISLPESLWEEIDSRRERIPGRPGRSAYLEWLISQGLEYAASSVDQRQQESGE